MSLFSCCPKKPKKSLDYVIKWVEETDKTLKELVGWKNAIDSDIESLVKEAVENYDWSNLPQEALNHKADKVQEATEGNFASLDSYGNLLDSGYKANNFAEANHSHNGINLGGNVANHILIEENDSIGRFHVQLWDSQGEEGVFSDYITGDMLNNTFYPATAPAQGGQKLITSGAVYTALQGKADSVHTHSGIEEVIENAQSAKLYADNRSQGEPAITIELADNNTPGSPVIKSANIDIENIDNLNRALTTPSSIPEDDATKLITSKAVFEALAKKANFYNGTLRVDSAGDNSYPIPEDGVVQTALNSFVESAEQDKMYNVLVQFANQYSFNNYYPAIVYWTISSQDATVVHIYVGDYHFNATKAERATAWDNEEFVRTKISTFLETF